MIEPIEHVRIWWRFAPTISRVAAVAAAWAGFWFVVSLVVGCATLREAEQAPCPPTDLVTLDARFVAEAVSACKDEQAPSADECRALPGIRAKYAAERARWVECKGS